jgi:hypothetical protein
MNMLASITKGHNTIEVCEYDNGDVAVTIFSVDGSQGSGLRLSPVEAFTIAQAIDR